jgi:hypothetical protein
MLDYWSRNMKGLNVKTSFFAIAFSAALGSGINVLAQGAPANQKVSVGPSADTIRPYRPVGRDPFKKTVIKTTTGGTKKQPKTLGFPPLDVRRVEFQQKAAQSRVTGLPEPDPLTQYLVNELDVIGVFQDGQGPGAFVRAQPTGTTFFVRRGARCYNGEVLRVETDESDSFGARVMFREVSFMDVGAKQVQQERVVAKVATAPSK